MADRPRYRGLIDALVQRCPSPVLAERVRAGVWHRYVDSLVRPDMPEWMVESARETQREMQARNDLLAALTPEQREVLLAMLNDERVGGMHDVLVVLYEEEVPPFDDDHVYEGTAYHDFIGRLHGWAWPEDAEGV